MYARVMTASYQGLDCEQVWAEADSERGMPGFAVVGLASQAIKESKERIHSAVLNCGFSFPDNRLTVNLTPAGKRKEGSHFDLPIAISILISSGQLNQESCSGDTAFLGELTLNGRINPVEGVLPMAIALRNTGVKRLFIPEGNLSEAMLIKDILLYPVKDLRQISDFLSGLRELGAVIPTGKPAVYSEADAADFSDIRGQAAAKRAVQIAAAGLHGVLLIGSPGCGKTLIGKRIPGILPPLSYDQQLEVSQIYSVAGLLTEKQPLITQRPFRSPHHNMSASAMVGGGTMPNPGEVSLAHNGVLFLDELPEFNPSVLDTLRQPLEDGIVTITRTAGRCSYPCRFMLVAAMNPCRCGYYGDPVRRCTCSESDRKKYVGRVSGPMLDRIDIHVGMHRPAYSEIAMQENTKEICSEELRKGVMRAFDMQRERYKGFSIDCNARLQPNMIPRFCRLDGECEAILKDAFAALKLSARSYHRIIKVSRTIADIEGIENIKPEHILEALSYRLPEQYFE